MKRIVSVQAFVIKCSIAVFFVLFFNVFLCGENKHPVITMIDNPEGQTDSMIALQNRVQKETGIDLKVEVVPPDQVNVKLETALAAGVATYDIFSIDTIDLPKYAAAGWVLPLNNFITPKMEKDILPFAKNGVLYQGKLLGLPWKAEWMSFTYNKEMIKKIGFNHPPVSWDELVQMSVALKKAGIVEYPMIFTWGANYEQITSDYVMIVASMGGEMFDAKGTPVFNKGAGVEALQLMYDMMYKHKIVDRAALTIKGGGTRRDLLAGGQGAFAFLWGTPLIALNDHDHSALAGQFDVALAPAGKGGPYSLAGPMGWAITSTSKNKEAAWKFLMAIAGPEGEKEMFLKDGSPAGWRSVIEDPVVSDKLKKTGGDVMKKQADYLAVRPAIPYYSEWSSALQQAVQRVLTNMQSPQKALDELAKYSIELKKSFKR